MTQKTYNLFLDDDDNRIPHKLSWIDLPPVQWVRAKSYDEFVAVILRDGVPTIVSFDHDLADEHYQEFHAMRDERRPINYQKLSEKTGRDCALWLVNYCLDNGIPLPIYYVHTLNGEGAKNIISIMESARKIQENKQL